MKSDAIVSLISRSDRRSIANIRDALKQAKIPMNDEVARALRPRRYLEPTKLPEPSRATTRERQAEVMQRRKERGLVLWNPADLIRSRSFIEDRNGLAVTRLPNGQVAPGLHLYDPADDEIEDEGDWSQRIRWQWTADDTRREVEAMRTIRAAISCSRPDHKAHQRRTP